MTSRQAHFAALSTAFTVAVLVASVLWLVHPPLYNSDGFVLYFRGADDVLQNIHPHHLLWVPLVRIFIELGRCIHWSPMDSVQFAGTLMTGSAAFLTFRLMQRQNLKPLLLALVVMFLFWSPWVWQLSTQSQPYPLLILLTSLILLTLAPSEENELSIVRLILGSLWVSLSVALHQAAILWVPTVAVYLGYLPSKDRKWIRMMIWFVTNGLFITVLYAAAAQIQHFRTGSELFYWITKFSHTQHGFQLRLPDTLLQVAVGIVRLFIQTQGIETWLWAYFTDRSIAWMYVVFLLIVGWTAGSVHRGSRTPRDEEGKPDRALFLSILLVSSWTVFCVLWEPANYYWCVVLVPFIYGFVSLFREWMNKHAVLCGLLLSGVIGWNGVSNYRLDRYYEQGAPSVGLSKILNQLTEKDRFIVISKGEPANTDYDVLDTLLSDHERSNEVFLMEDFVLAEKGSEHWEQRMRRFFEKTWQDGGKVYCASALLNPDDYSIAGDMLSFYRMKKYEGVNPKTIYRDVQTTLQSYQQRPSSFQLGSDRFFELKPPSPRRP